jgi:hypothetical protein
MRVDRIGLAASMAGEAGAAGGARRARTSRRDHDVFEQAGQGGRGRPDRTTTFSMVRHRFPQKKKTLRHQLYMFWLMMNKIVFLNI